MLVGKMHIHELEGLEIKVLCSRMTAFNVDNVPCYCFIQQRRNI